MRTSFIRHTIILAFVFFIICCERKIELPAVETVSVEEITETAAKCTIKVTDDGGDVAFEHGIVYSSSLDEPVMDIFPCYCGSVGRKGTFTIDMLMLSPGITYYVRAYAQNEAGTAHGDVLPFTTAGNITGEILFNPESDYGSVTDIEGNVYKTVQIGNRIWMAENLKTTKYRDGTDITEEKDLNAWENIGSPKFSWFLNDKEKYGSTYGALYNWHVVNNGKLCPDGWHVSSSADWTSLEEYIGSGSYILEVFYHLKESGNTHWFSWDSTSDVDNFTGFTALPGGYRGGKPSFQFNGIGWGAWFWASDQAGEGAIGYGLGNGELENWDILGGYTGPVMIDRKYGFSVRCVKNQ